VGFSPATVVRLEGALAHSEAPGIWYFGLSVLQLTRLQKLGARTLCCARDDVLRKRLLSNVGGCGQSVGGRRPVPTPTVTVHVPGTVDNLDAGTQHRAVGDSTAPRYVAVAGAVKPAPDADHPVSRAEVDNPRTDTPDPRKNVLRVVDNRLLRGPPG
jgi:hypothetical protein